MSKKGERAKENYNEGVKVINGRPESQFQEKIRSALLAVAASQINKSRPQSGSASFLSGMTYLRHEQSESLVP